MTAAEQLKKGVDGESIHDIEEDQCCPDFSCCTGEIAPKLIRERFYKAYIEKDKETQMNFLMIFLGNLISKENKKVHIAGDPTAYSKVH